MKEIRSFENTHIRPRLDEEAEEEAGRSIFATCGHKLLFSFCSLYVSHCRRTDEKVATGDQCTEIHKLILPLEVIGNHIVKETVPLRPPTIHIVWNET